MLLQGSLVLSAGGDALIKCLKLTSILTYRVRRDSCRNRRHTKCTESTIWTMLEYA